MCPTGLSAFLSNLFSPVLIGQTPTCFISSSRCVWRKCRTYSWPWWSPDCMSLSLRQHPPTKRFSRDMFWDKTNRCGVCMSQTPQAVVYTVENALFHETTQCCLTLQHSVNWYTAETRMSHHRNSLYISDSSPPGPIPAEHRSLGPGGLQQGLGHSTRAAC